jgi:periplasmic protein TonB
MTRDPIPLTGPPRAKAFLTWSAALFLSGALHAGAFALALNWQQPEALSEAAPPAVMIDLLPAAPVVPKIDASPGPQAPDSAKAEVQHTQPTLDPPAKPAPQPQQQAAVAIPEPSPARQIADQPKRDEAKKSSEQRTLASRSATPATFEAQHKATARARATGAAASPAAVASWKSELMAQLNRYKRYPPGTERGGTSLVAFSVDRSGAVTGAHLARSSGDTMLDQEAVSLPRRASPLPAPPEGMTGNPIALTVPIHFER